MGLVKKNLNLRVISGMLSSLFGECFTVGGFGKPKYKYFFCATNPLVNPFPHGVAQKNSSMLVGELLDSLVSQMPENRFVEFCSNSFTIQNTLLKYSLPNF